MVDRFKVSIEWSEVKIKYEFVLILISLSLSFSWESQRNYLKFLKTKSNRKNKN
jgi:hypothetical protein